MNKNKYYDEILKRSNGFNINKTNNVIKVNIKNGKDISPRGNNKASYIDSNSKIKNTYNNNNTNLQKNLFNKTSKTKNHGEKNNIKNIKYTISYTQKKFFKNEKIHFFIMKIKKIILKKFFQLIKKKFQIKNKRYKKNSNLKMSDNKHKLKSNLSSNKKINPKIFENKINKSNSNILKKNKNKNNSNHKIINGNIGLNRPPSQLSIKSSNYNINNSHLPHKQNSVKMKINKNIILNDSKKKKNNLYCNSIEKKNNKQKKNYVKKLNNDKKNKTSKRLLKTKNNITMKLKNDIIQIKNEEEKMLKKPNNGNYNYSIIKGNEDIQYCNTEINRKIINSRSHTCKVYENCLLSNNNYFRNKCLNEQKMKDIAYSPEIRNLTDFPFFKKNISPKKSISNKNISKNKNNNNHKSFNSAFPRYETNPINNNGLYELLEKNDLIKKILFYWNSYSMKKKIIIKILSKVKFYKIIKKSISIVIKRIIKALNYCVLSKYFNKYKNIYFKRKILQNLILLRTKEMKYMNIPIQKYGYDIINNININNYINYPDINKFMKKREQSPIVLSKLMVIENENNNNPIYDNNNIFNVNYNGNIFNEQNKDINNINNINDITFKYKYNYYNENFISFSQTERLHNQDNSSILKTNKKKINLKENSINNKTKKFNNNKKKNNNNNNNNQMKIIKKNILIDRVNQLRMVFNLLEQQGKRNGTLYDCFNKWSYITNININLNDKNKELFYSFSGKNNNINYNNISDISHNSQKFNKYSINTFQEKENEKNKDKEINNPINVNKKNNNLINSLDIGKYTPVRGIKNFRSKTSKKISNSQKIYDYNDTTNTNKILHKNNNNNNNYNIFDNDSIYNSCTLMKSKSKNNSNINLKVNMNMNIVYQKKKLITPYHLCGTCFMENNIFNNNTYCDNLDINNSMKSSNINFYNNNQLKKTNTYYFNSTTNINSNQSNTNNELNNTFNSFCNYNTKTTFYNHYPIKSYSFIQQDIIEEKKNDNQIINKIEEKEINFALYKRNNSYDKSKENNNKINNDSIRNNNKKDEIINIIYKKGNLLNHNINYNINNKIKNNINNIFNIKKIENDRYIEKTYEDIHHKSAFYKNLYIVDDVLNILTKEKIY